MTDRIELLLSKIEDAKKDEDTTPAMAVEYQKLETRIQDLKVSDPGAYARLGAKLNEEAPRAGDLSVTKAASLGTLIADRPDILNQHFDEFAKNPQNFDAVKKTMDQEAKTTQFSPTASLASPSQATPQLTREQAATLELAASLSTGPQAATLHEIVQNNYPNNSGTTVTVTVTNSPVTGNVAVDQTAKALADQQAMTARLTSPVAPAGVATTFASMFAGGGLGMGGGLNGIASILTALVTALSGGGMGQLNAIMAPMMQKSETLAVQDNTGGKITQDTTAAFKVDPSATKVAQVDSSGAVATPQSLSTERQAPITQVIPVAAPPMAPAGPA
jgi:hypothetical protein